MRCRHHYCRLACIVFVVGVLCFFLSGKLFSRGRGPIVYFRTKHNLLLLVLSSDQSFIDYSISSGCTRLTRESTFNINSFIVTVCFWRHFFNSTSCKLSYLSRQCFLLNFFLALSPSWPLLLDNCLFIENEAPVFATFIGSTPPVYWFHFRFHQLPAVYSMSEVKSVGTLIYILLKFTWTWSFKIH